MQSGTHWSTPDWLHTASHQRKERCRRRAGPAAHTASSRTSARPSRLCENAGAAQNKKPKPHPQGHAGSHDKNTDPTTTPAPAQREAIAVPTRTTIRAPVLPPVSVREIRPPTRRNTKDPSYLHDSAPPHNNPARRVIYRRKRRGQAATRGHAARQRYLSTLPLIRPHLRLTLTPETPSTVNHAENPIRVPSDHPQESQPRQHHQRRKKRGKNPSASNEK